LVVSADETTPTIGISLTFTPTTCDGIRLRYEAGIALADGVAIHIGAECVWAAGRGVTGVRLNNAFLILANVAMLTVRINHTFGTTTSNSIRLGNQPRLTPTYGVPVEVDGANSTRTTRRWVARVWLDNTMLRLADITRLTVRVNYTFRATPSDCIRFGNQSRLATTYSIPISYH
jgi:hypothetical protein